MKKRLICWMLLLCLGLCGCGQRKYDEGYEAGYAEAMKRKDAWYAEGYADGAADCTEPTELETTVPVETVEALRPYEEAGFVNLSEAVPQVILEIRYYSTYNFVGERIDGYEAPVALVTKETADALKEVCADLEALGYRLKIYDAYRPKQAVEHFQRWAGDADDVRMKEYFYPEIDKSNLFQLGFISRRSSHSRGATVDVSLVDMETGMDVDMGTPFDFFGEESHTNYTKTLTEEQISNRTLLRDTMLDNGFKGISTEWWHFRLAEEPYPDTYFAFPVE